MSNKVDCFSNRLNCTYEKTEKSTITTFKSNKENKEYQI